MDSQFQQIYIHHNLFRPDKYKCCCDEFTCSQNTSKYCYCVPNNILEITTYIFGIQSSSKSKCNRFGMKGKSALKREIGFSIHQLSNFSLINMERDIKALRSLTELPNVPLKYYVILLCAHFDTIILTTNAILNASSKNSMYSTMLCRIKDAYDRENPNNSLLMEIYFYICFCTRGTHTFNAAEIVGFYKKIKKCDTTTAGNILLNLKNFEEYCKGHSDFLSTVQCYLKREGSNNYLACVFQFFLDLTKYNYSHPTTNNKKNLFEILNCDKFLELFDRVNTAFSQKASEHELSPERLIKQISAVE